MRARDPLVPMWIGPFRILRRLGAGGMAETFVGVREGPGGFAHHVCVKRVLPALAEDPELRRLFFREARLVAELRHRSIARVVELGEANGAPYLALELVEGLDLRALLARVANRRLPEALVARIGLEVAEALEHAHGRGIVHRDVSPANILVSVDGEVKLADFGIGKPIAPVPGPASLVRGNLCYMAPERLAPGALPSPSADVYSLGVVLFECLAGARPIPHGSARDLPGEADASLRIVVEGLIARAPEPRLEDARGIVDRLSPLGSPPATRRALGELVRQLCTVDAHPRSRPASDQPPSRWRRYAFAPGIWAAAERAAQMRSRESAPPPSALDTTRDDDAHPVLPPAFRAGWLVAGGVAVSFVVTAFALWLAA